MNNNLSARVTDSAVNIFLILKIPAEICKRFEYTPLSAEVVAE